MKCVAALCLFLCFVQVAHAEETACAISPLAAYQMLTNQAQQSQAAKTNRLININTASVAELIQLPRIGVKKAQAIVDYRQRYGAYSSVDDLTQIKGIGKKTLDRFRHRLTIQ